MVVFGSAAITNTRIGIGGNGGMPDDGVTAR